MITTENTWKELRDAGVDIAIVPVGAIEQHGHHLPLATDFIIADGHARKLGEELGAYVLPAMPFGCSREHMAFPGTITLRPSTLAAVLEDIVESLRHHGFRKIVLFSAHGGNWVLKPTMRELNFKYPDLTIVWSAGPVPEDGDDVPADIHAGQGETSRLMHYRPDLVREAERTVDSPGVVGQEFNDYVGFDRTTRTGAWGNATRASKAQGDADVAARVQAQARYIRWALARVEALKSQPGIVDDEPHG